MKLLKSVASKSRIASLDCAFRLLRLALPALLLVLWASNAQAQFQATVQGTVTDSKGAVVQAASVTLTDQGTQVSKSTTTSNDGFYRFVEIAPGKYTVAVEAKGFEKKVINDVDVAAELARGLDIVLEVGQVSQTVTVDGSNAPALETEEGNMEGTLTTEEVVRLPEFGRDPYELIRFSPGIFADMSRNGIGLSLGFPN